MIQEATELATKRYTYALRATTSVTDADIATELSKLSYIQTLGKLSNSDEDKNTARNIRYKEWLYTSLTSGVYELLKDKLAYNPNRIISPGWDDQDVLSLDPTANTAPSVAPKEGEVAKLQFCVSPIHVSLMDTAFYSRCATAYIDVPKSLPRADVYNEDSGSLGYAQKLARIGTGLYSTHSALFAPWGHYMYVGTGKQNIASPSFLALRIQRAMILNQSVQYEWALPTNRKHNLNIGALDYKTPKKVLDIWQNADEGVGVNVITQVPDMGTCLWGNSTLFEVPPATYQALANLSTRLLFNAVENIAYKVGVGITFQYNISEAWVRSSKCK